MENLSDTVDRLVLGGCVAVLVDLLGGADVGVAQNQLGISGGHAQVFEHGGGHVSEIVDADAAQPCPLAQPVEHAGKVPRPERSPVIASNDKVPRIMCGSGRARLMLC
nr:hypothetical protein [Mycobacteroides abscessus]